MYFINTKDLFICAHFETLWFKHKESVRHCFFVNTSDLLMCAQFKTFWCKYKDSVRLCILYLHCTSDLWTCANLETFRFKQKDSVRNCILINTSDLLIYAQFKTLWWCCIIRILWMLLLLEQILIFSACCIILISCIKMSADQMYLYTFNKMIVVYLQFKNELNRTLPPLAGADKIPPSSLHQTVPVAKSRHRDASPLIARKGQ